MILLITYDLHKPDRDYTDVIKAIKQSSASWAHPEESVWLIETDEEPNVWRDRLRRTASDATYFVIQLRNSWASHDLDKDVAAWLKNDRDW